MDNKKIVAKTALITAIITFVVTACGMYVYMSDIPSKFGIATSGSYSKAAVEKAAEIIKNSYYEDVDESKMYESAIEGMMASLGDEYSWFVNEQSYNQLENNLEGEYSGIGVYVTIDPADELITVISAIEDTPAYKAGFSAGDKIIAINETAVGYSNYQEAVNMLRGSSTDIGKDVTVTVKRAGKENTEEIILKRERIILKTVKSRMLPSNIGYIRITSFDTKTADEFNEHLNKLGADSLRGLVIDLRNNGGGIIDSTKEIADKLLPEGLITYFEYKDGTRKEYKSDESYLNIPLAVLINGSSASASEVLAGAIRDHERGILVGEKSFGKGIVQTVLPFIKTAKGQTAIYITTARYFTPNGECIHKKGIEPNINISMPEEYKNKNFDELTLEQDSQLKSAWENIKDK